MTWLYFVFVQSVFVFVGQTLTMAGLARSIGVSNFQRRHDVRAGREGRPTNTNTDWTKTK